MITLDLMPKPGDEACCILLNKSYSCIRFNGNYSIMVIRLCANKLFDFLSQQSYKHSIRRQRMEFAKEVVLWIIYERFWTGLH